MKTIILETKRLYLRQWCDDDLPIFAQLNADPKVMAHFPKLLSTQQSYAVAKKIRKLIADRGWGFWAVELKDGNGKFIGFVGLHELSLELPFAPCIEIGWRLHSDYWGKGYATEAATEALRFAFTELNLNEVVSFTTTTNLASQAVMQRIGMSNTGKDFYHPALEPANPLAGHVLYKITNQAWQSSQHMSRADISNYNTNIDY